MKKILAFCIGVLVAPIAALAEYNPANVPAVASIAKMQALGSASAQYGTVYVLDWGNGGGGGGNFKWVAGSSASTNACMTFSATGVATGRWVRQLSPGAYLTPQMCGATGDNSHDDTVAIQAALTVGAGGTVLCPAGDYKVTDTITVPESTTLSGPFECYIKPSSAFPTNETVLLLQGADTIEGVFVDGTAVTATGVNAIACLPSVIGICQAVSMQNVTAQNFDTTNSVGINVGGFNKAVFINVSGDTNYINWRIGYAPRTTDFSANTLCLGCLSKSSVSKGVFITERAVQVHFIGGDFVNNGDAAFDIDGTLSTCAVETVTLEKLDIEENWLSLSQGAARNAEWQVKAADVCNFTVRDANILPILGGSGSCNQQAKAIRISSGRSYLIDNSYMCNLGAGNITVLGSADVRIMNWPATTNGRVGAAINTSGIGAGCVYTEQTDSPVTVAQLPTAPCTGSKAVVSDATQTLTAGIGATVAGTGANQVPVGYSASNWRIGG